MEDGGEKQKSPVSEPGEKAEEGKLCLIKIKVPKGDQNHETNCTTSERMNDKGVFCSVCDKGFASGKALAGHMRIHFHQSDNNENNNHHQNAAVSSAAAKKSTKTDHQILLDCWAKRENNSATAAASVVGPTTCSICSKNFPSMKSLFGHMRCHPEREWRGINPPPSSSKAAAEKKSSSLSSGDRSDSGSDSTEEIPAVDLAEFLPKWSATDRRGRKPRAATSAVVLHLTDETNARTAVTELMRLARGDSSESGLVESSQATSSDNSPKDKEAENEGKNWVLESRKRRIIEGYSSSKKLKFDEGESSERVKASTDSENLTGYKNFTEDELEAELIIKKKKMKKKMKLSDLDCYDDDVSTPPVTDDQTQSPSEQTQTPSERGRYVCTTCNKCFPSHQALGGHRSSHNKARVISTTSIIDHESSSDQNELQIQTTQLEDPPNAANHRCKICNKTFPTGQALGGHKRCHWTGPAVAPSTSAGEASQITGNKVLGFDLNEPPPDDEECGAESEHAAAGYGYASSSHNSS